MTQAHDCPTPVQYALGVNIGHLAVRAAADGATPEQIVATLEHCLGLARFNLWLAGQAK